MIAIDTNVVVRYLVQDDPRQSKAATALIERERVFASATVMLEADWVLRANYRLDRLAVVRALANFGRLPTVTVERSAEMSRALAWAAEGMDLADALHLVNAAHCESFASFDRALMKIAAKLGAPKIRAP